MKKLTADNYRNMPWKNGAGTTIEMAVFPEHAQLDNFVWRISRAMVVTDGGFSHFADIDRTLALLSGLGMRLNVNGDQYQLDQQKNMAVFPGDAQTHAESIDGPISDFNLMSRRTVCTHHLTHWEGKSLHRLPVNTVFLYCAKGVGKLTATKSTCELTDEESLQFSSEDNPTDWTLECSANSQFYCAQIDIG